MVATRAPKCNNSRGIRLIRLETLLEQPLALLVCTAPSEPGPEGKGGVEADHSHGAPGPPSLARQCTYKISNWHCLLPLVSNDSYQKRSRSLNAALRIVTHLLRSRILGPGIPWKIKHQLLESQPSWFGVLLTATICASIAVLNSFPLDIHLDSCAARVALWPATTHVTYRWISGAAVLTQGPKEGLMPDLLPIGETVTRSLHVTDTDTFGLSMITDQWIPSLEQCRSLTPAYNYHGFN